MSGRIINNLRRQVFILPVDWSLVLRSKIVNKIPFYLWLSDHFSTEFLNIEEKKQPAFFVQ